MYLAVEKGMGQFVNTDASYCVPSSAAHYSTRLCGGLENSLTADKM